MKFYTMEVLWFQRPMHGSVGSFRSVLEYLHFWWYVSTDSTRPRNTNILWMFWICACTYRRGCIWTCNRVGNNGCTCQTGCIIRNHNIFSALNWSGKVGGHQQKLYHGTFSAYLPVAYEQFVQTIVVFLRSSGLIFSIKRRKWSSCYYHVLVKSYIRGVYTVYKLAFAGTLCSTVQLKHHYGYRYHSWLLQSKEQQYCQKISFSSAQAKFKNKNLSDASVNNSLHVDEYIFVASEFASHIVNKAFQPFSIYPILE